MKKAVSAILIGAGILAGAAETTVLFSDPFDSAAKWFKNPACETAKFGGGGSYEIVPDGESNKCLKVVTDAKQTFMFNLRTQIPIENGARVRIVFRVKGKGGIDISPMGKTADSKTVYLLGGYEKVNAAEWEKIPFIVSFKDPKGAELKTLHLRMNVRPNSDLLIDSCTMEKIK